MSSEQEILKFLKEKEKSMGVRAFARLIRTSDTHWILTRDGKVPLGERVADGAAKAFPELEPNVLIFLRYEKPARQRKSRKRSRTAT